MASSSGVSWGVDLGANQGPIEVIDLSALVDVRGGADRQTRQMQLVIAQLVSQMKDLARNLVPKGPNVFELLSQFQPTRRSRSGPNSGPNSAPALPPPSTLTR